MTARQQSNALTASAERVVEAAYGARLATLRAEMDADRARIVAELRTSFRAMLDVAYPDTLAAVWNRPALREFELMRGDNGQS